MSEYTPTTKVVRGAYLDSDRWYDGSIRRGADDEFDRWLNQVKADSYLEGYERGREDGFDDGYNEGYESAHDR